MQLQELNQINNNVPTSAILQSASQKLVNQLIVSYRRPRDRRSHGENHHPPLHFCVHEWIPDQAFSPASDVTVTCKPS